MAEATTTTKTKAPKPDVSETPKYETAKYETPKFEMPKFEMPQFELPKVDFPVAFREFAEKGAAQAKDAYEKMKTAAEDSTAMLEETYATASKGVTAYNLKLIEAARANANAAFDFASEIAGAKSLSEAIELSSANTRKQFDALSVQTKELAALAQKVATDSVEPMKSSFTAVFSKAS
jgi:phasin